MEPDTGEALLRAWLELASTIWSRQMVSGMTYNEAVVSNLLLHQMQEEPDRPLTATELCEKTNIRKSQMNALLSSLEARGYLRRSRSQEDRRRVRLYLTEAGAAAYQESHKQGRALIEAVVDRMGEPEVRQLTDQLIRINATVQETLRQQQRKGQL